MKKIPSNLKIEHSIWQQGIKYIAGIDEAGRGPLAGPVVAAAVIFEANDYIPDIKDSKELSPIQREESFILIKERSIAIGIGIINNRKIDKINIRQATFAAMLKAINSLTIKPEYVLIDGRDELNYPGEQEAIIGGDNLCFTISAASIIAKVTRDRIMEKYHKRYPYFGFSHNKGYATKFHRNMIQKYGPCRIHRKTFLSKVLSEYENVVK